MSGELLKLDPEGETCLSCGKHALDTGWECTECGYDCKPFYYPEARSCTCHPADHPPQPCPRKYALHECRAAALAAFGDA